MSKKQIVRWWIVLLAGVNILALIYTLTTVDNKLFPVVMFIGGLLIGATVTRMLGGEQG